MLVSLSLLFDFLFYAPATTEIYTYCHTLSLHDALPILLSVAQPVLSRQIKALEQELGIDLFYRNGRGIVLTEAGKILQDYSSSVLDRSEEHTSELQSLMRISYAVFCLKKKTPNMKKLHR